MALVGEFRIHLGTRHAIPGHLGGCIVHLDGVALLIHRREGVVDVGDLVPWNIAHQIGGQAVLAGAPGGEVADDPAGMIIPHALVAIRAVDLADIAGEVATGWWQRGLLDSDVHCRRLAAQIGLVSSHQLEGGTAFGIRCPVNLPGGGIVFPYLLAIDKQLDFGHIVVGIGDVAAHRHAATQRHLGTAGRAADAHLGRLWRYHGSNVEARIRLAQYLAILIQCPRFQGVRPNARSTPAGTPGRGAGRGSKLAVDKIFHLGQGRYRATQAHRQRHAGSFVEAGTGSR